jgi:L-amino acid N-acyltransferase YncA
VTSEAPTSTTGAARTIGERSALLRTGETVAIREVVPSDEAELHRFFDDLCLEARRLRFFTGAVDLERMAHRVAGTGPDRIGLLALDADGRIAGHALCINLGEGRAEVAVEVADRLHGGGLGTILVERLAQLAEQHGIPTFVADVLPENRAMLDVFRDGFDAHVAFAGGVDRVEFPTAAWRLARERFPEGAERDGEVGQ